MNAGHQWERCLEAQHREYMAARVAMVHKTQPTKRGAAYTAKAPPDYMGTIRGGRSVAIEAKHTDATRLPLSAIKPHQARDLTACHELGGLAFVALRIGGKGYALSWAWLGPVWRRWQAGTGTASIKASELEHLPELGGEYGADWLAVLG